MTPSAAVEERFTLLAVTRALFAEEVLRLSARVAALEAGLREIKEKYGHVCENYELCAHASCQSSYGAWAIADALLTVKFEEKP